MAARKTPNPEPTFLINKDYTGYNECIICKRRTRKHDKCSTCRNKEQLGKENLSKKKRVANT